MTSLRSHEGYFCLDHSQTQGVPDELVIAAGLPAGAGKGLFEAPTYTCSHCQAVVVINPKRNRERAYCRGCDHMVCDACGVLKAAGEPCKTMKQKIDEMLSAISRAESTQSPIILP